MMDLGPAKIEGFLKIYDPVTQEISGVQIGLKISFDPSKGGLAKIITSNLSDLSA